ncbi:MAG: hypothetical protein IBX68_07720 [Dehalococcoidia bacterium]|nr:hypothetical protein [Dehalococcoidia bacterium]
MVRFLNTTQARGEVERMLTNAQSSIVIISPFIKIHDALVSRLRDAAVNRNVRVSLVCRADDLRPQEKRKIEQIPNLQLYFNEKVHAKCFYNEVYMVIGSLNLYDSSTGDNREMGVLLSSEEVDDTNAFDDARNEAEFIIRESSLSKNECNTASERANPEDNVLKKGPSAKSVSEPSLGGQYSSTKYVPDREIKKSKKSNSLLNRASTGIEKGISHLLGDYTSACRDNGYCLRCGTNIPQNAESPYCPACYRVWAKYKRSEFEEHFCHACGEQSSTSMKKPLCASCYQRTRAK